MTHDPACVLTHGYFYPLGDRPTRDELEATWGALQRIKEWPWVHPRYRNNTKAVWNGKPKRPPNKGEWYLGGAIIEAYRALNDLSTPFHIATLVATETITITQRI